MEDLQRRTQHQSSKVREDTDDEMKGFKLRGGGAKVRKHQDPRRSRSAPDRSTPCCWLNWAVGPLGTWMETRLPLASDKMLAHVNTEARG